MRHNKPFWGSYEGTHQFKKPKRKRALERRYSIPHYWTVVIPYVSGRPTPWHPYDKHMGAGTNSTGSFKSKALAHHWAKAHLAGHAYHLKKIDFHSYTGGRIPTAAEERRGS